MPFISDTASAIKSRFGFHKRSTSSESVSLSSVRNTPDLLGKSAVRENPGHFTDATSAIGSLGELFKVAGLPMVENCMGGYNDCMFANGQTGSGKTHTMLGDIEGGTRRHSVNCEMTPRMFEHLFTRIQKGAVNRKVAATNMNHASSRSHSLFTCIIESKWESQAVTHHRFARLNLVDLAGSERSSGAEGERLKETTNINKSLSTLGLVIMNLVNISKGKSLHVPYRDSKFTFLLQAVVNEDASGDVAMRLQIQQLKRELSRLQGFINGKAENLDNDSLASSVPASPAPLKGEGLHGSFSPLTSDKGISQKKDYEVALVGVFKREREKEAALQALTAETQAAMQLAKEREDEIQSLKMRLRFREAGIKRLKAVASGKILKSLCDEGQLEMMNEHIKALQNKLLELDWKLVHESYSLTIEKTNFKVVTGVSDDLDELISRQDENSGCCSNLKEENEFLGMQKAAERYCKSLNEGDINENVTTIHADADLHENGKEEQEREEFKRMFSSLGTPNRMDPREFECPEKLVEVDGGEGSLDKSHVQLKQDARESQKLPEVIPKVEDTHLDRQSEAGNHIAIDQLDTTASICSHEQDTGESLKLSEVIPNVEETHSDHQSEAGNHMAIDQLDTAAEKLSED
ncbi:Alpha/beta-Hydrolases superfamily protein [Hibiscus syriacus]|uniref:Kinesin-like protein n=1 Tax=Hibiscus syriacus TaxID=106335 RepID=A0A6A2YTQ3_HIBSY|nr:Alpha/beta-Hydrolases superfamily protein [Hibiscus syriacus]